MSCFLFGKVPAREEFVKHGLESEGARKLDAWIAEASMRMLERGQRLAAPVRGVFDTGAEVAIFVAAPSTDRVGRDSHLVVGRVVTRDARVQVVAAASAMFERAESIVASDDVDALIAEVDALPEIEMTLGAQRCEAAFSRSNVAVLRGGALDPRGFSHDAYAFETLRLACARGGDTALECPIRSLVDVLFWASAVERASAPASMLMRFGDAPKLVVAPKTLKAFALSAFAAPSTSETRLWPLVTESAAAKSAASEKAAWLLPLTDADSVARLLGEIRKAS